MNIKRISDNITPIIFGISGQDLTDEEIDSLKTIKPFGIILFSKNCASKEQIRGVVMSIKNISPLTKIFIDQEGGRVQRIKTDNGGIRNYPPQKYFGDLYRINADQACKEVYDNYYQLGQELKALGIDVTFAPVCDLYHPKQDKVIGDRAFSDDPDIVILLAARALKALQDSGIKGVIKHIPGHGRATKDTHKALPKVDNKLSELEETDFKVCGALADNASIAMTAHIVYSSLDPKNIITQSPKAIDYIRNQIGFTGLIISDDIRMQALTGNMNNRAKRSFAAGCDIVMYCEPISFSIFNFN